MAALTAKAHQRTIGELIKTANALHSKVTQSQGKTDQLQVTLGLTLREAKERKPADITWPEFVKEHFDFGRSRADQLIQIADGRTTVEEVRATTAARVQKAATKPPIAIGESDDDQPLLAEQPKEDQAQQIADADAYKASREAAVKAQADRAEATAAAKLTASKPQDANNATTPTSAVLINFIEQLRRIDVSTTIYRMSNDDRIAVLAQIVNAVGALNKMATDVSVSGGAHVGKLAPVPLRLEVLEFLKAATARIEGELAGWAGAPGPPS